MPVPSTPHRALRCLAALCSLTLAAACDTSAQHPARHIPSPPTTSTAPSLSVSPWHAQLISTEPALWSLVTDGSQLYAIDAATQEPLRIDPLSGRVLARGPHLAVHGTLAQVVVAGDQLWVATVGHGAMQADVSGYDLHSLVLRHRTSVHVPSADNAAILVADPHGSTLFVGSGDTVTVLDARTGAVRGRINIAGPISSLGVSPDGRRLYVAYGRPWNQSVRAVDPTTGTSLGAPMLSGGDYGNLLPTGGGLFLTWYSAMEDGTAFVANGHRSGDDQVNNGGGGDPPIAGLSEGVVWVGGPDYVVCADPRTGRVHARAALRVTYNGDGYRDALVDGALVNGLVAINGKVYAQYEDGINSTKGIIAMQPPAACGLK